MIKLKDLDEKNARYERKFVISEAEVSEVEQIIKHHPAIFSEIFYERQVNNIYFDSIDLSNYHANLSGDTFRIKSRIRWYGSIFGKIENPVLELKIKNNELGWKLSFPLKSFKLDNDFSLKKLQEEVFTKSNLPDWLNEKIKLVHPSLLNSYKRKYFISSDKINRITLDFDLRFFNIKSSNNYFKKPLKEIHKIVLELKYSYKEHSKAISIAENLQFRIIANSKYVSGIDLVNF